MDVNKVLDGLSIFFHLLLLLGLYHHHAYMWYKAYLSFGANLYNQFPLTYYDLAGG
jgi:hypothetical protein